MNEEELERLMQSFNTQMKGIGAAGAAASVQNRPIKYGRLDDITSEPASELGQEILDSLATLTPGQILEKALEAGVVGSVPYLAMLSTLLKIKEEADPRFVEQFPNAALGEIDPDPRGTGAPGWKGSTTDKELFNEIMKEFLERDRSPAPEIPEYTPLDYEPFERSPPLGEREITEPLVSYWETIQNKWGLATISKYNMDYNDSQGGPAPYAPPGEIPDYMYANPHLNLPANPWPEYADAEGYAEEAIQPFSRGPDGITPVWSWEIEDTANKEFEEFREQQEFAERNNREEYDAMVAEMVETERLRQEEQEEYDAEMVQRYTDKYNENPYFYDNLLRGGGSSEYDPFSPFPSDKTYSTEMDRHPGQEGSRGLDDFLAALGAVGPLFSDVELPGDFFHRLDPSVGWFIDNPISQGEIILNQTRPGGSIGLSEQILNQTKPGAYIYPGMLN